jgi:DNA polymerase-1
MLTDAKKVKKAKRLDQVNIFDIPMDKLSLYAGLDARLTYELYRKSMYELHQESMTKIFHDIEMPFLFVLMEMEEAGFFIDGTVLGELNVDFANQRDSAKGTFLSISDGVNPDSNPQVAKYLFETLKYKPSKKTESGAPSVDVMSLTRLLPKDKNGAVAALLAYRKYEKLLGTYIEPINERTQGGQLRLRGEFNQTGTVTGRLSSSNPNLQNIPARGDSGSRVRSLFSAPKGYSFLDADYSQLELRICAHYSQDPNLVKTFIEGGDPHQLTADLCGVDRSTGKTLNFGVLYGSGPKTMADTVEKSGKPRPTEETTKKWLQAFDKAYPTIVYMKQMQIMQAREQGYVETIGRRKRRLPDINNRDQSLRARAERQTSNSVIQGSAADIIKYAMLSIFPYMGDYDAKMTAQVHDELCFEVPEEAAPEFSEFVSNRMIGVGEYFDMLVPLEASPGIGKNWDEAKH